MVPAILTGQKKFAEDEADKRYLQLSGGTLTGPLTLSGEPSTPLQAASKGYIDNNYVAKTGGSVSGALLLTAAITQDLQAVTKSYVDNAIFGAMGRSY